MPEISCRIVEISSGMLKILNKMLEILRIKKKNKSNVKCLFIFNLNPKKVQIPIWIVFFVEFAYFPVRMQLSILKGL